jgi:hypothetical protein
METLSDDTLDALWAELPFYAEICLMIQPKDGQLLPLKLNAAQTRLHKALEAQRERTGKVRALVLKARQQGFSTYIAARFYHRAAMNRGQSVFILTHEKAAAEALFDMVGRFHQHNWLPPHTGAANARALTFDRLDCSYSIGTAGTRAVGRSRTVQMLHGSEVAFWPHAASHFTGVVQAVPDLPGTEIILESTANGLGGEFHERWQQAEAGIGDYVAIFAPWFWTEEYRREPPEDFVMDAEEQAYAAAHGLDAAQMCWRRAKLAELNDPMFFRQEYPATAAEAFQVTGHDSFIAPASVLAARKAQLEGIGPLIIGADPAQMGEDRFSIARRRGRKVFGVESRSKLDTVAGANWLRQVIEAETPARVFIDVGGSPGVYDLLVSWDFGHLVTPVNFGGSPMDAVRLLPSGEQRPGPKNRRAEMWLRSREWLEAQGGADIPDRDSLQADACSPGYSFDAHSRLVLESKQAMRARGLRSPDEWDAVALTFAEPVRDVEPWEESPSPKLRGAYGWMA